MAQNGARKARLIAALLAPENKSLAQAAASANVPLRTAQTWLTDPAFAAELRAAEDTVIQTATRQLTALAGTAVGALADILADETLPPNTRRLTAVAVLDLVGKWRETRDLEERLAALEESLAVIR